jgi:two-component system, sensor histidine kinase SagS
MDDGTSAGGTQPKTSLIDDMRTTSGQRRILVLKGESSPGDVLEGLDLTGQVEVVGRADLAIEALRRGEFDVFICPSEDLPDICSPASNDSLRRIFEALGQGLCLLDSEGQIVWANAIIKSLPSDAQEQLRVAAIEGMHSENANEFRGRRFDVSCGHLRLEVTTVPLLRTDGTRRIAIIVTDTTHAWQQQQRLDAIDRAGSELVRLNVEGTDDMDVPSRLKLLEQRLVSCTMKVIGYDKFLIRLLNPKTGQLEVVIASGMPASAEAIDIYASTEGNGISGYVAATGRSYICNDVQKDPLYLPGMEGARSSLTVPLRLHDRIVGIFNIEADQPGAFREEDRQVAEILGRYIAIALHMLQLIVTERCAARGQTARDLAAQIAAPLNDILADAATLMDQYIAQDDLLDKLKDICLNVNKVKESVQQAERQSPRPLGEIPRATQADALLGGKRVLVADDEPVIRQTLNDVLSSLGCLVDAAKDGEEACSMVGQARYDLIVCDVKMPNRNGYAVFAMQKDKDPTVPVIFMTGFGYDPNHSIIRARRQGLEAVLFKPFKVDELLDAVREALKSRQAK